MKTIKYILLALVVISFTNCNDYLDKTDPTKAWDDKYWTKETEVDLYANTFYPYFFSGYGIKYSGSYSPMLGYTFSDDIVQASTQTQFTFKVPQGSIGSTSDAVKSIPWQSLYAGPEWNFAWIRKANVMQDRLINRMQGLLSEDSFNHWLGVARFFKGLEYARLVNVFGDVPYYENEVYNTQEQLLYEERTPRNEVMDHVYDNFKFALENIKLSAGEMKVNRYVAASYIARWALVEGTWQKYHKNDAQQATKFLQLAVDASDLVMSSGKYDIVTDFRSLFTQEDLTGNKDVIFFRRYSAGQSITHSVASNCNMSEPRSDNVNLNLLKAFICVDGNDYQTSTIANAKSFQIDDMIKTRDPRFEASFYEKPTANAKSSYIYTTKFIPRSALNYLKTGGTAAAEFQGEKNTTAYPTMRYAEVLLTWIEAKAELAALGTGPSVSQSDIDVSINKLRDRKLAPEAIEKGVVKVAPLKLSALPNDPNRDPSVSPLLWEIRRERRMEFVYEHARIIDLRRWKKLDYMDTQAHPDLLMGVWVDFPSELPNNLDPSNKGKLRVVDANGDYVVYDGTNGAKMKGFWATADNKDRLPFLGIVNMNPYLCPMGLGNIRDYQDKGYTLQQTEGWPGL